MDSNFNSCNKKLDLYLYKIGLETSMMHTKMQLDYIDKIKNSPLIKQLNKQPIVKKSYNTSAAYNPFSQKFQIIYRNNGLYQFVIVEK